MLEEFRTAVQTLCSLQFLLKRASRKLQWTPLLAGARQQISRGRWAAEQRATQYESKKHLAAAQIISQTRRSHSRTRANPRSETCCLGAWRPEPSQHQNDGVVLQICLVHSGEWPGPRRSSVSKFAWSRSVLTQKLDATSRFVGIDAWPRAATCKESCCHP